MSNLTRALFRIDPTEGLVDYVQSVKPYHTKIMEVLVEYIYKEEVNAKVGERWKWCMDFTRPGGAFSGNCTNGDVPAQDRIEILYACGYGYRWDTSGIVAPETTPTTQIIKAVGKILIDVSTTLGSSDITILRNTAEHDLQVGDPLVFESLPTALYEPGVIEDVLPGVTYFVTSVSPTLTVSETEGGTPHVFAADAVVQLLPQGLPYNSFLVEPALNTSSYNTLITNLRANQLSFVEGVDVTGVNPTTNKFTVASLPVVPAIGDSIYLNDNTSPIANGKYTVASIVGTTIEVVESIPPLTPVNGSIYLLNVFDNIPYWPSGAKVRVSSTTTLPYPLSDTQDYYFIPHDEVGVFNLATKRYPSVYEDYIDLTSLGKEIQIRRVEPFSPGDFVNVQGSKTAFNDGQYIVATVAPEGANFRVSVMQSVRHTTPTSQLTDGFMVYDTGGYSTPDYCSVTQAPDLFARAFVDENLQFTFSITERDFVGVEVVENEPLGWGTALFGTTISVYGSQNEALPPYSAITDGVSTNSTTLLLLPTGFDTQMFDQGAIDEDLRVTTHLQNLP